MSLERITNPYKHYIDKYVMIEGFCIATNKYVSTHGVVKFVGWTTIGVDGDGRRSRHQFAVDRDGFQIQLAEPTTNIEALSFLRKEE